MLTRLFVCDIISTVSCDGEVSEWFKELVLKTSDPARDQGFESLPLRHLFFSNLICHLGGLLKW